VLEEVKHLLAELPLEGSRRLFELWKQIPERRAGRDVPLSPLDQLRYLLIRLSEHWDSYRVFAWQNGVPWTNNATEIVFTQMTKTYMFTSWTGGDHVSDFDIFVLDDHSINELFYQFPLLFKTGIIQSCLNTAAKSLDGCSQAGEFILSIHLMNQLLFQVVHTLEFTVQICSSALILSQWNNLIQVSFCEPIQLGLHSELSPTQVFATCLQFLWQPATTLCSLQGGDYDFRVCQEFTQVLPHQFIQLAGRDETRQSAFVKMRVAQIYLSLTHVVNIARG